MVTLYGHQQTALGLLRVNDGFALFMEQGTGKTFPVLFRLAELAQTGRVRSALVVAPKAVVGTWADKVAMLDEGQRKALQMVRYVSYDYVWRHRELTEAVFDAVVLDEAHFVKSPSAKRTKACMALCSRAKYRYILTGTPTSNGQLCNLWSEFACIDPVVEQGRVYPACFGGDSYYKWIDRVAYLDKWHKPYRYRHVDELQGIMAEHSYRITKAECLDLPEKLPDERLRIHLETKAVNAYRQMVRHSVIEELDTLAGNPLTRALRLRQMCSGFVVKDDGTLVEYGTRKVDALKDLLEDREGKTVVFCDFRHSIDLVSKTLDGMGIAHVTLDGRTSGSGDWKRFQTDPEVKVIVAQYQSGSAGIDLYMADLMVFFEPCLSSNLTEQARDRIHRVGQTRACSYVWLLTEGTIEVDIYRALSNYADFGEKLFREYIESYVKGQRI